MLRSSVKIRKGIPSYYQRPVVLHFVRFECSNPRLIFSSFVLLPDRRVLLNRLLSIPYPWAGCISRGTGWYNLGGCTRGQWRTLRQKQSLRLPFAP